MNYYMLHGGTNFGRSSGGPFLTTSYDYNVIIDEFGDPRDGDFAHLAALHKVIHSVSDVLTSNPAATAEVIESDGADVLAYIYGSVDADCMAFLVNADTAQAATGVSFNGISFDVPAWSVSLLTDCKTMVYNTRSSFESIKSLTGDSVGEVLVNGQGVAVGVAEWKPVIDEFEWGVYVDMQNIGDNKMVEEEESQEYEPYYSNSMSLIHSDVPLEQIATTKHATDYLIYSTVVTREEALGEAEDLVIGNVENTVLQVRLNGNLIGQQKQAGAGSATFTLPPFNVGDNVVEIISSTVGTQNFGADMIAFRAGKTNCHFYTHLNTHLDTITLEHSHFKAFT